MSTLIIFGYIPAHQRNMDIEGMVGGGGGGVAAVLKQVKGPRGGRTLHCYLTTVDGFHPVFCLVSSLGLKDHDVGGEDEPKGGRLFRFFVLNILDTGERVATLDLYLQ